MSADLSNPFHAFDRGAPSRRQLLQALGIAVAARPAAFAQGQCGGARKGTPECDPTPARLPFASTGWKTVLLDHFSCQAVDYAVEAAFYSALMNWPVRSDDGRQAMLDIGDWGGVIIRGGYVAPPPPPAVAMPPAGAGGPGGPAGGAPRAPRNAALDGFCFGIDPWDAKKVEAELRARGLSPVADNRGDFQSFHVKDPDGFDLQVSNGNRRNRRQTPAAGKTSSPAPFASPAWKTVRLDHISFGITPFDRDAVKAELTARGLSAREDTGGRGDIHTAAYKSCHTTTPNGYDLQISATTRAGRGA